MKTNELIVRDWVRIIDDDTDACFDARVEVIDMAGNVYVKAPGDETAYPYSVDCVEPIYLTQKTLEKNGFKNCKFFGELLHGGWQILCDCSHLAMRHETGWMMDISCSYIHELQHALQLCGIEIEIKL